jgi:hypothetical protein
MTAMRAMPRIMGGALAGACEGFFRAVKQAARAPHCSLRGGFEEWAHRNTPRRNAMTPSPTTPFRSSRALGQLAALAAAATLAASAWAAGVQEEGYMLDAQLWRSEVAGSTAGHRPADGWYRIARADRALDVRRADPRQAAAEADDAFYVRVPGAALKTGQRPLYRMTAAVAQPRLDHEYHLTLGKTSFGFTVEDANGALTYTVRYVGQEHVYRLGVPGSATAIQAIADLDGDARPDFIVDVGEQTYLLLSGQARPGANTPSAELWAAHEGC